MNTVSIFTPARVGRAGEDVALQIEVAIVSGKIPPGESLPSERELQAQFKTGRGVIREALTALRQKGLLEIRKGSRGGAFVKQVEVAHLSQSLALFLKQQHVTPEQLIEFRESMDRTITVLAIARGSAEEKARLVGGAARLEELAAAEEPDMATLGELDRELNVQLARMSGNSIFEWIMDAVQIGLSSHDHALYEHPEYRIATAANWSRTACEIAANEPMGALSSIGNHYVLLRRLVQESASIDNSRLTGSDPIQERS
jgi:GntR family transcriptional regulator, transcriptional repressor for pyruvate dehydrogenase complex